MNACWWLIPSWWKQPLKKLPTTFNARAETIASSRFFKDAFERRRCLMPVTGWYEYQGKAGHKRSLCFHLPSWELLAFAGIYETWQSPDGEIVTSFAIATTQPSQAASKIHDRMPVVLHPDDYSEWLDPENREAATLERLLTPWDGALEIYETTGFGNSPHNEGPECIEPAGAAGQVGCSRRAVTWRAALASCLGCKCFLASARSVSRCFEHGKQAPGNLSRTTSGRRATLPA